ncbi:MAG: M61 family metallopeptidase [Flavobacteriales bacterium]
MPIKILSLIILAVLPFISNALELTYNLSMPQPNSHYFAVTIDVKGNNAEIQEFKMPVWTPGSYLVREFSKNLNQIKAIVPGGKELVVVKKSKNAWEVQCAGQENFTIFYEVYAFELSVRTPYLDNTHGFVAGAGVFMYNESTKNQQGVLKVFPHQSFKKVSTALSPLDYKSEPGCQSFLFENYDQLVDCPIEIGNQTEFDFMAAGVRHRVAMYGEANYNVAQLQQDMAKVVQAATNVFGSNPNKDYLFIIHNVTDGQGGLEHKNSCVLSVDRWSYAGSNYIGFINLVAHEYFHLWNVKRIRPIELGPFNYDQECYTSLLWVMEGITSYYDELLLRRSGFYTPEEFISKLQSQINYVEGTPGSRVQPVAHASFDAWIKAYRPNENSSNTTMTYYSRGAVLGAVLDAYLIQKSNKKKSLDGFMQLLYNKYALGLQRGFTEAEFEQELSAYSGEDMHAFFTNYVNGTQIIPYQKYFEPMGILVKDQTASQTNIGATFEGNEAVRVKMVRRGSAAEDAGLSVGDEVLVCNGYRINKPMLEGMLNSLSPGESMNLTVARDQKVFQVKFIMKTYSKPQFSLQIKDVNAPLLTYWLR